MAKSKRTLTYQIEQKIKNLHKLIVTKGNPDIIKQLQADVDYFYFGVKQKNKKI